MAENEGQIRGVLVEIFGEEFTLGAATAAEVEQAPQAAAYVDRIMRQVDAENRGRQPRAKVAILAAMEIALELFRAVQERKVLADRAHANIDRLTQLIDERATLFSAGKREDASPLRRLAHQRPLPQRESSALKP